MEQQARNVTMKDWGFLAHSRYLLHDRDGKFCPMFREVIQADKVKPPEVAGGFVYIKDRPTTIEVSPPAPNSEESVRFYEMNVRTNLSRQRT
jgi:hypothetical protein